MDGSSTAGKIALVTGATDGLGRALAGRLAAEGAVVIVHGRDPGRIDATVREIVARSPDARVSSYRADLSSIAETRTLAASVETDFPRLDLLVNNAGIGSGGENSGRQTSTDGYELRFAVNYLAGFLLATSLLPALARSPAARIVNVASVGQAPIDFDDVMLEHGYTGRRAYSQSKLAQILFTFELAERLRASGRTNITVNALHPSSLMPTKIVREAWDYTLSTLEDGLEATWRPAASPELEGVTGRYYDVLREARANDQAYDPDARRRLWDLSERLVSLPPDQEHTGNEQ